mgnify:CR=1 FL=1
MNKDGDSILKDDGDFFNANQNAYESALNSDNLLNSAQIAKVKRLEFSPKTKRVLAQRVGYRCSCPKCNNITIGPGDTPSSVVILGEAAHIVGAIKQTDGLSPRADPTKSEEYIKSLDNGIWLCRHHHKLVDSKSSTYTVELLKNWKKQAEEKQDELLIQKESDFVESYIFPQIDVDKGICTSKFKNREWCLLAYLIENYDNSIFYREFETDDEGRNFFSEYQNWMSKNSIDSKISGIRFYSSHQDTKADVSDIVNKLTGLVILDNFCLNYGKAFDEFIDKLYSDDENALEKIKSKLSKV